MGWTVLYIACGIVALWLLAEVLIQYKARLRWRALAFVGFLTVVVGVVLPSIVVIVLGAIAFAVKAEVPEARVHAVEVSDLAVAWATRNRDRLGLDVDIVHGDAVTALGEVADVEVGAVRHPLGLERLRVVCADRRDVREPHADGPRGTVPFGDSPLGGLGQRLW